MTPREISELAGAFLAGSGVTEIIRWFLGRKTRAVQNSVSLGKGWEGLVQEMRADREDLRERLQILAVWRDEAVKELISLRQQTGLLQDEARGLKQQTGLLQDEVCGLKQRTEHLELENRDLREENVNLQKQICP